MDNFEEETPLVFKVLIILIILSAIFGAVMGIVDLSLSKLNAKKIENLTTALKSINVQINDIENSVSSIDASLKPGGIVDLYINAYHFLSNTKIDLERIVTLAQNPSNGKFFAIYVTGKKSVWIGISQNKKYVFQSEMTPGLSARRFYVDSLPSVLTAYTLKLEPSAVLKSGDPENTYILVHLPGETKIVKMQTKSVEVEKLLRGE